MKLICFDLDDTLWNFETALPRAEDELHNWLHEYYPDFARQNSIEALSLRRRQLLRERAELRHDIGRVRWLAMQMAAEQMGYDHESARRLANAAFKKFMVHRNEVELFNDVMPAMQCLRKNYTLCSLTNGNADLKIIGLADIFHHQLSAQRVGAAKPAAKIFHEACRLANVDAAEAVHVGDDPQNDVLAARAAGMKTVWVNRKASDWTYGERADIEIRSLADLEAQLQQLLPVTA